jgi:hypothetical protein
MTIQAEGAPTVADRRRATFVGRALSIELTGSDPDGDALAFTIVQTPMAGILGPLEVTSPTTARIDYTPDAGFEGEDVFTYAANDGVSQSQVGSCRIAVTKKFIPWMEMDLAPDSNAYEGDDPPGPYYYEDGARPGMTMLEYYAEGMRRWSLLTDEVIITMDPGQVEDWYPQLMAVKPANLQIIGGIKTSPILRAAEEYFVDLELWEEIAASAQCVAELTGNRKVVLENESATEGFYNNIGKRAVCALPEEPLPCETCEDVLAAYVAGHPEDPEADFCFSEDGVLPIIFDAPEGEPSLRSSLERFRELVNPEGIAVGGIQIWWYRVTLAGFSWAFNCCGLDREEESRQFVQTVDETMGGEDFFFSGSSLWPGWREDESRMETRIHFAEALLGGDGFDRMCERLATCSAGYFVRLDGSIVECYTPAEALDEMRYLDSPRVEIYCGRKGWIAVPNQLIELLNPDEVPFEP